MGIGSLFLTTTPPIRPYHLGRSKQATREPTRYPNLYRTNSTYELPTPTTPIQESTYTTCHHLNPTTHQHLPEPCSLETFASKGHQIQHEPFNGDWDERIKNMEEKMVD